MRPQRIASDLSNVRRNLGKKYFSQSGKQQLEKPKKKKKKKTKQNKTDGWQKEDIQILCVTEEKNNTLNNTEINVNKYALGFVWQTKIKNGKSLKALCDAHTLAQMYGFPKIMIVFYKGRDV